MLLAQTDEVAAQAPKEPFGAGPWHVWAEAMTDVPVMIGARFEVEGPLRLRAWTSLGVIPSAYVEVVDAAAQAFGGYNDQTSELIVSTIESSLVWRLHAGWRPLRRQGFGFDFGYTLATLGGATTGGEILSAAIGRSLPTALGTSEFDVASTLHLLGGEASYRWSWPSGLALRLSLGFVGTVAASATVEPESGTSSPGSAATSAELERFLRDTYTSYVHSPYLGIALGYDLTRLFDG
jgi:hypothetical protein